MSEHTYLDVVCVCVQACESDISLASHGLIMYRSDRCEPVA